jgi:competence protein ComEC
MSPRRSRLAEVANRASTPIDLRLAVGAVAAWLAVSIMMSRPAIVVLIVAITWALVGGASWLVARPGGWLTALAAVAFSVTLVLLPLSARLAWARDGPLARLAGQHANVLAVLRVASDPRPLTGGGAASTAPRIAVDTDLKAVRVASRTIEVSGQVVVFGPAQTWHELIPGQLIRARLRLAPAESGGLLSAVAAAESTPEQVGRAPWWQRAAEVMRSSLKEAASSLPEPARGLLPGLVDGDTSDLDPILAEHFRTAGLMHLLAVSGDNAR